jgi:hypothetical protein
MMNPLLNPLLYKSTQKKTQFSINVLQNTKNTKTYQKKLENSKAKGKHMQINGFKYRIFGTHQCSCIVTIFLDFPH